MKTYVWDFETTGLSPHLNHRPFACGLESEGGEVLLSYPAGHRMGNARDWKRTRAIVEDPNVRKVCHHSKFDVKMARAIGWKPANVHDTFLMAHLLNEYAPSLSLKALSASHLGDRYEEKDELDGWLRKSRYAFRRDHGRQPNFSDVPKPLLQKYLEKDLDNTLRLWCLFKGPIWREFRGPYEVERLLVEHVVDMELAGVRLDIPYIEAKLVVLQRKLLALEREVHALLDYSFNLNAPAQLLHALSRFGYSLPNTSRETLEEVAAEEGGSSPIMKVLEWRSLKKVAGTFLVPFLQKACGEFLFAQFWQCGQDEGIKTNRFSSSDPNMQNIPTRNTRAVRRAFVPRPGQAFVFADYEQIEMRLFAHYSKDHGMLDAFHNGVDVYVANASRLTGRDITALSPMRFERERFKVKVLSLATNYGLGLRRFAAKASLPVSEAKALRDKYFREFPTVKRLAQDCTRDLLRLGYVTDDFGRRYRVPRDLSYKAINALIQGTAAGVLKRAMIRVGDGLRGTDARMLMTIHDELVVECPEGKVREVAAEVAGLMADRTGFSLPMTVSVKWSDRSWAHKRKLEA